MKNRIAKFYSLRDSENSTSYLSTNNKQCTPLLVSLITIQRKSNWKEINECNKFIGLYRRSSIVDKDSLQEKVNNKIHIRNLQFGYLYKKLSNDKFKKHCEESHINYIPNTLLLKKIHCSRKTKINFPSRKSITKINKASSAPYLYPINDVPVLLTPIKLTDQKLLNFLSPKTIKKPRLIQRIENRSRVILKKRYFNSKFSIKRKLKDNCRHIIMCID